MLVGCKVGRADADLYAKEAVVVRWGNRWATEGIEVGERVNMDIRTSAELVGERGLVGLVISLTSL